MPAAASGLRGRLPVSVPVKPHLLLHRVPPAGALTRRPALSGLTRGFSIVELMVTVAIAAILLGLGAPSMVNAIRSAQINAIRDELVGAVQFARVEALRRASPIVLLRKSSCDVALSGTADWSCGFTVFADTDGNGAQGTTEPSIKDIGVARGYQLSHTAGGTTSVQMNHWGQATGGTQRFVISASGSSARLTTVCFNAGGRIQALAGDVACP